MSIALIERRNILESRLHDGWTRIETAEQAGQDTTDWTTFWLALLVEYEGVYRELAAHQHDIPLGRSATS